VRTLRTQLRDESGIALITVIMLITVLLAVAVALPALTSSEGTRSNNATRANSALQAAEGGLNVYVGDLTEDTAFYLDYVAAGEARRTYNGVQYPTTAGANSNANVSLSPSWAATATWTYPTDITTDPGWRTLGSSAYQYLLEVFPNANEPNDIRIIAIGRPTPTAAAPASDTADYRAVEAELNSLSISDFQMLSATDFTYGSTATTNGWVYATDDDNDDPAWVCSDGTATADMFTENTLSSYKERGSGCNGNTTLVSPAREYSSDSSPSIRTVINEPITFADLRTSDQIAPETGGEGAIELDAAANNLVLSTYGTNSVPNAWQLKFTNAASNNLEIDYCNDATSGSGQNITYYPVAYKQPTCSLYKYYTLTSAPVEIYTTEDVIIQGVVDGQVTVYTAGGGQATTGNKSVSEGDIIIGNNITYATSGSDVLGMVADENLIIACWELAGNLSWRGASMELNGRWETDGDGTIPSSSRCSTTHSSVTFTGSTAVYGGSAMSETFTGTRTYNYDSTLRYLPPPDYPEIPSAFKIMYERQIAVP
jgi:hypothetical protein